MFEQEIEIEKKNGSIVPLLLIVTLIIAVVGVALYFVAESKKVLTAAEASPVVVAYITPKKFHRPDHTTACTGFSEWV